MDDRDLEARLRDHLHRRLDAAQPTPELVQSVSQVVATRPAPVGLAALRHRPLRFGFALAALSAIAALAIIGANLEIELGPGGVEPTPTPGASAAAATNRTFVVRPRFGSMPVKSDSTRAADQLSERLRVLGFETFEVAVGNGIEFLLPIEGPADDVVRDVLEGSGIVEFVPLPPADYGLGKLAAEVGQPLPKDEPVLFGWDGIDDVELDANDPHVALTVTLREPARHALATYTTSHVGEQLAVVIDGDVAALPTVMEPIANGELTITTATAGGEAFLATAATLFAGVLPESWHEAQVPPIISREAAAAKALEAFNREAAQLGWPPADGVQSVALEVVPFGDPVDSATPRSGWLPVWNVVLTGEFRECIPGPADPLATPGTCPPASTLLVVIDADNGTTISMEAPAPDLE